MPRAKTKKTEEAVASKTVHGHAPEYRMIPIRLLETSPTNPRKRFPESSILELAGSIREKGILEPLIVRELPNRKNGDEAFEIVCGERRYRASWDVGGFQALSELPCLVRELTDEQVLDIQIHENLHREDVHPMDEALGYKFLMDQLECGITEIAVRVGKSESYVANRLKLNQLIPEVQKDLEDGFLTLTMALEIAKYSPEAQIEIYGEIYEDSNWDYKLDRFVVTKDTDKELLALRSPVAIAEYAAQNILHLLAKAPFDKKATNLRLDGLACVNCPNRTGANASLFEGQIGKKDSCLDPVCFKAKTETHIKRLREKIAHENDISWEDVPLVRTFTHSTPPNGEYLGNSHAIPLSGPHAQKPGCENSVSAVDVQAGETYGTLVKVCLASSGCSVHWGKAQAPSMSKYSAPGITTAHDDRLEENRTAELIKKRERREEIFDIRVSDIVRKRVFRLAADGFVATFSISGSGNGFLPRLVAKIWVNSNNGEAAHTRGMAKVLMSDIMDLPQGQFSLQTYDLDEAYQQAEKLSDRNLKLCLFFLVHGEKGHTYYDRMSPQTEVRELAKEYGLDYTLIDAHVRVEVAEEKAKKHLDLYKAYLAEVEAGKKNAKIPRPWAPSYKPPA